MFCTANGWDTNRSDEEVYDSLLRIVTNDTEDFVRLGIEHDGRLIAYGDLAWMTATSADVGIAIGERSFWGRGIGSCALPPLMKYRSKTFGINSYTAETHDTNVRSRRRLENVRFTQKGAVGCEWYQGKKLG